MSPRRSSVLAAACILPMLIGCWPSSWTEHQDLSDFEEFEYERLGLFALPEFRRATIERRAEGGYEFQAFLAASRPSADEQPDNWLNEDLEPLPARQLSPAEVERLQQAFSDITIEHWSNYPMCVTPAWFTTYRWDDREISGFISCPGGTVLSESTAMQIAEMLDDFRQAQTP